MSIAQVLQEKSKSSKKYR